MNNQTFTKSIKQLISTFIYTIIIGGAVCCTSKHSTSQVNDNTIIPNTIKFVQISTGILSSCGLTELGSIYCFGHGSYGEIGNGKNSSVNIPTKVKTPLDVKKFIQISTGSYGSCTVTNNGYIYCWGGGRHGQLGNGSNLNSNIPVQVKAPVGIKFTQVATGSSGSCALTDTGVIYCWGYGKNGELGNGNNNSTNVPTKIKMPTGVRYVQVATSLSNSCALSNNGTIYCWGDNTYYKLGNNLSMKSNIPIPINSPSTVRFAQISTGSYGSCAVSTNHELYCFGFGKTGIMSNGGMHNYNNIPTLVKQPQQAKFKSIADGGIDVCGLTTMGSIYCWGYGVHGQIGDKDNNWPDIPTQVMTKSKITFTQISTSDFGSCALTNTGKIYCWGYGIDGQIGNGLNKNVNIPTPISPPQDK